MPYKEPGMQRLASHKSYLRNKPVVLQRMSDRRSELRDMVNSLKGLWGCRDCCITNPILLDFHHIGPKRDQVSKLVSSGRSKARVLQEIGKCIVLCSNCHRLEHFRLGDVGTQK